MKALETDMDHAITRDIAVSADELIRQFDASLSRVGRRVTQGVYYTPRPIVDHLVAAALSRSPARRVARPTILDPACGAGVFLLAAFRRLTHGVRSVPRRFEVLRSCIFGVDADAAAIEAARRVMSAALFEHTPSREEKRWLARQANRELLASALAMNLRWCDALFSRAPTPTGAPPVDWHAVFPNVYAAGGFDVVLANPPFLSYSGREAVKLSREMKRLLAARFGPSRGWLTAHGCFLRLIAETLSRGVAAVVLPEQVAHLSGYAPVRGAVTRRMGIVEVRNWGERAFGGVVTPVVTVIFDRDHRGAGIIVDEHGATTGRTRTRRELANAGDPWRSSMSAALRGRLWRGTFSLGKLVADPGVHTGNAAAELIAAAPRGRGVWSPVLQGRDIGRYECGEPVAWLRTDLVPSKRVYFRIAATPRYAEAAFVIRQTASHPIVAPRRHADFFRNSLLALYSACEGVDVRYLVGVLNSRLMRLVYRATVGESRQRTFPQVKVSSLRALPIKQIDRNERRDAAAHDRIVALVASMLELPDDATDRAIDEEVEELYGLTEGEMAELRSLAN